MQAGDGKGERRCGGGWLGQGREQSFFTFGPWTWPSEKTPPSLSLSLSLYALLGLAFEADQSYQFAVFLFCHVVASCGLPVVSGI